ncbi:hypothetical protein ACFYPT_42115 [Streptomyces sp. NPDC005529]|uniref:hypothetical protein n=1 Tax=unclassified Streptomyces TaxID=2593676 RepID=UPI0033AA93E7
MADTLLQDLWFHHAQEVALDAVTMQPQRVTLHTATASRSAACPSCEAVSAVVHSRCLRRLDEVAAAGQQVVVE